MHYLNVNASNVYPQSGNTRDYGFSVRCILKPTSIITFEYDSNVTSVAILDSAGTTVATIESSGGTAELAQGQSYTISLTFASGYALDSIALSSGTNVGTLSDTIFTPGTSPSTLTISAKSIGKCTSADTCMQTYTLAQCQANASSSAVTLTDARDGQTYTVRYINGNCWMTRNLAIGCNGSGSTYGDTITPITLTNSDSNLASNTTWATPTTSLDENDGGCSGSGCNNYTTPMMKCNSTYGGYYNYAAATAETIIGNSNATEDTYNICPVGWTLPTSAQTNSLGTSSGSASYVSAFSPVNSGLYNSGPLINTGSSGYGFWWSRTAYYTSHRYLANYGSNKLYSGYNYGNRDFGYSVRCVRES